MKVSNKIDILCHYLQYTGKSHIALRYNRLVKSKLNLIMVKIFFTMPIFYIYFYIFNLSILCRIVMPKQIYLSLLIYILDVIVLTPIFFNLLFQIFFNGLITESCASSTSVTEYLCSNAPLHVF